MIDDKGYLIKANLYDGLDCDDDIIFYQNDTRQSKIVAEFTGKKRAAIDVADCTVVCVIQKSDKEIVTAYMENDFNVANRAEYVLSQNALASTGKGIITIFVYGSDNERQTFGSIKFKVLKDVNSGSVESTTEYPVLTKLISDTKVVVNDAENAKNEILVVSADIANSEKQRVSAETKREENESSRINEFAGIKKEYESLKSIMIDENNAANLQNQINEANSQLEHIDNNNLLNGKFKTYLTIDVLKSKNLKIGDIVHVIGYYTMFDNSKHYRKIENEDDGTGVQLNNGLWANIYHNGEISILDIGITSSDNDEKAYLDRQSDLFNKLGLIGKSKVEKIKIPSGWYRFGKPLILPLTNIFCLEGQQDTVKSVNFVSYCLQDEFLLSTNTTSENHAWGGLSIKNIRFNSFRHLFNCGVKIHFAPWVKFDNVLIEGFGGHGLELGKVEDSEFNKLSIFECGRSSLWNGLDTENSNTDGDITTSIRWALYLNNSLVETDANNMIRFIDCRIERNRSYPYVNSDSLGAFWVNFYGLHSEIQTNREIWNNENVAFMRMNAGVTTFTDCHIDNFGYQVVYNRGEIYASNCRLMSLKSLNNGNSDIVINLSNCNSERIKLGANAGSFRHSNGKIGQLHFTQTETKVNVSNCELTELVVSKGHTENNYAYFSNCFINGARFDTDTLDISVIGGRIINLEDNSYRSRIDCYVDNVTGLATTQPTRNLSTYGGSMFNHTANEFPPYHNTELAKLMAKGGVIWNTDFTTNKYAGWVYNPKTGGFEKFGAIIE